MNTQKIPATIVTGFLGSGKTTLMRHILSNSNGLRIAVIVNEFGELGIDGEILRSCGLDCEDGNESKGQLYELANGCMCCTVQEEFFPVMKQLAERRDDIDVLLIETSGLALPKPLVQAFRWPEIASVFTVDSVVTVVDTPAAAAGQFAENPVAVEAQRMADDNLDHDSSLHELFEDQLLAADLVVLNKVDLCDAQAVREVEALVRSEVPPEVKLVHASRGELPLAVLLGLGKAAELSIDERKTHHDHDHDHDHHDDHDHDAFDSCVIDLGEQAPEQLLSRLQALLKSHDVLRLKGFVAVPGKPMRLLIQGVGKRIDHYYDRAWSANETRSTRLVFIGRHLHAEQLKAALI